MAEGWNLESEVRRDEINVILLKEDSSCDMAEVELNGENIFTGNFWDYHPGCHGNILPENYEWDGREGFVESLRSYIINLGEKVVIETKDYKYVP